jgi:hypothetical protein
MQKPLNIVSLLHGSDIIINAMTLKYCIIGAWIRIHATMIQYLRVIALIMISDPCTNDTIIKGYLINYDI